nr:hypothetical protein CFP56_68870 [Quercus suber]
MEGETSMRKAYQGGKTNAARSWKDHDWPEWASKLGTTQVIQARSMRERNMYPSSNNNQSFVMNKEEERDDEMISCSSRDDSDWFLDKARKDFPNKDEDLYDITEALHM